MTTDQSTAEKSLRQLTAQELIDIITEVNKEKYAEFYRVDDYAGESIVINAVEIGQGFVAPDNVKINLPLYIWDSTFNKGFIIRSGTLINLNIHNCIFNYFEISDCTFNHFETKRCTFNEDFSLERVISNYGFKIWSGVFSHTFQIKGGNFSGSFDIYDGKFSKKFTIEDAKFSGGFRIWSGIFNSIFETIGSTFSGDFGVGGGLFIDNFIVKGGISSQEIWIEGSTFHKEIILESGQIYRLRLSHLSSLLRLRVDESCQINTLLLQTVFSKDSLLRISGNLHHLIFDKVQNFGTIVLTGLSFRQEPHFPKATISHDNDDFFSIMRLSTYQDQSENAQLRIINSDLGKTTFIDCDLSGFGLEFRSSKITDVFVTGTKMPDRIITPEFSQQQLGYSQIKKIYENRGDKVEANRYYAREMDAYYTTLSWRKNIWEKFNLGLNKFSTNHGQSWQRGLLTTVGVGGLFYTIYCWLLGFGPALSKEAGAITRFGEVSSYFMEFINPIHKADYVAQELLDEKVHVNGWARTIEGISRIFIAYFVYQLIQAFRKHGKSSG